VLALYLRHAIVLSSDSVNNHVHVWYIAHDLWHHARLPWRMPVLAHGQAYAYPYGFVNWTTAALAWPLFGNWAVTLWTAIGAVGCMFATFTAFPELRHGGWAVVLVGLGQATHAAVVLPIGMLTVLVSLSFVVDRREVLRHYALACVFSIPAVGLVFASPTIAQTSIGQQLSNLFITIGPRVIVVGLPLICLMLQRTGRPALAPVGLALALVGSLAFEIPLNVGQQWSALVHNGTDTTTLDTYLRSPDFVAGATYRVLRGNDGKLGVYDVLRAGGRLDSEMFPESMAIKSFRGPSDYATLLCARRVDRIVHYDTYETTRHTNEIAMIDALELHALAGVRLHPVARGPGWKVDAVDRSGCAS
jgi:hypothetical protein